jgi:hypothetical protein
MANAIDAGIKLTLPYGKSERPVQMRQRDTAMRVLARLERTAGVPGALQEIAVIARFRAI